MSASGRSHSMAQSFGAHADASIADGRLVEGLVEVVLRYVLPVHDP